MLLERFDRLLPLIRLLDRLMEMVVPRSGAGGWIMPSGYLGTTVVQWTVPID
jgi:hypothetical protein